MNNFQNFKTYLFLSAKKFNISVISKNGSKIYEKDLIINSNNNQLDLSKLDHFLNENVFKIEKILKEFIKDIYIILDCDNFFSVNISIKKNNYGEKMTQENLIYIINEARDQCFETLAGKKLIHTLIDAYRVDNQKFQNLPIDIKCNFFSVDIRFMCLPHEYFKKFEVLVNKYHISIERLISVKYLNNLFSDNDINYPEMARKVIQGYNLNEVVFTKKNPEKSTFFEKFFHFFN